jgi:hypothetical protein
MRAKACSKIFTRTPSRANACFKPGACGAPHAKAHARCDGARAYR